MMKIRNLSNYFKAKNLDLLKLVFLLSITIILKDTIYKFYVK